MSDACFDFPQHNCGSAALGRRAWPALVFGLTLVLLGFVIMWVALGDANRAGYAVLYVVVAASTMFASLAFSFNETRDALCLANAIPVAYFVFIFPASIVLTLGLPGADILSFMIGYHRVFVDPDSIGRALEMICGGSLAYFLGLLLCLTRSPVRREVRSKFTGAPVDLGRCVLIAVTALSLYCVVASAVAGSIGDMLRYIYDPVSREKLGEVWFRNLPGFLALVFLVAVTFAFAKLAAKHGRVAFLLCGVGFATAFVIALPYGNRQFALTSVIYPLFMWHYLRNKISTVVLVASLLLLPCFATLFLNLRQGGANDSVLAGNAWEVFAKESNMVGVLSATVSSFRTGGIGYEYGRDLFLIFTWFIPRGLWPDKAWPLDHRLALALGLADPNKPFGTPITMFGGLWLNFTEYGMLILLLLLGYWTMRLQRRLKVGSVDSVFWRAIIFCFLVDITRVGDIVREFWTAAVQAGGVLLVWHSLNAGSRGARFEVTHLSPGVDG